MTNIFLTSAIVFITIFIAYLAISKVQQRAKLHKRLRFLQNVAPPLQASAPKDKQGKAEESFIVKYLKNKNKKTISDFRIQFERCGWNPELAALFIPGYRVLSIFIYAVIFYVLRNYVDRFIGLEPLLQYAILGLLLFLAYRGLDYVMDFKISRRQDIILQDISMAIDLLVVCVKGGLSLDKALDRIAQEIIHTNPELAKEFAITSAELGILPQRSLAFKNLDRRINSEIVHNLTTSLIQAEEQGVAIGKTLIFLSEESSKQKLWMVERQAAKLPSKLTVPVVLLSLPAIMIIILGPTIATLLESDIFK